MKKTLEKLLSPDVLPIDSLFDVNDEIKKLSHSFQLLHETSNQVSEEANNTAKYLQEKLQETTYRFFSVIDAISDLVIIKDSDGRWVTLNKFGQELYGFSSDDYYNKTNKELIELFPIHAEGFANCIITDEKAWKSKKYYRGVESFEINDKLYHFDIVKTPIYNEDGTPKELIIIGRDITELKNTELKNKAFTGALNSASDNIFIMNNSGTIILSNDSFLKTFKFKEHSDIEGKNIAIIKSGKMPEDFYPYMWTRIRKNKIWSNKIIAKDMLGNCIETLFTIVPVMNGLPEPIYYICSMKLI